MKRTSIAIALLLAAFAAHAQTGNEDARLNAVVRTVLAINAKLGPETRNVQGEYTKIPEFVKISKYPDAKKIPALLVLISKIEENDQKMFGVDQNPSRIPISLATKFFSFNLIKDLVGNSQPYGGIREFLDGETRDIAATAQGQSSLDAYLQARHQRADRMASLYLNDKVYGPEVVKTMADKNGPVAMLANKTSARSLLQTCAKNLESCEKL